MLDKEALHRNEETGETEFDHKNEIDRLQFKVGTRSRSIQHRYDCTGELEEIFAEQYDTDELCV